MACFQYKSILSRWVIVSLLLFYYSSHSLAQNTQSPKQCGTIQVLEHAFDGNPQLKAKFNNQAIEFQQTVERQMSALPFSDLPADTVFIPIVFHIVHTNPDIITDAQIQAQLDVLNNDFAGMNSDSVILPIAFKPLFGKSQIQFKLAKRTPDNEPANGIVRTITTTPIYGTLSKDLKYSRLGGDDAWDPNRYFNVWITNLAGGFILGYSTFPGTSPPEEEGVVIHYTTLPADSLTTYNRGRTLTHETGHFFYLYHIWGDENGCTGTDFVDDTPNQGSFSGGCPGGSIITDACSPFSPGILYENYMDYTDDACMCLFTKGQDARMETALTTFHPGYLTSNGAEPITLFSLDAAIKNIIAPAQQSCTANFSPVIRLRNRGTQLLLSADISASIDNGPVTITHWKGSLSSLDEINVSLNSINVDNNGAHLLKVIVASPNGTTDQNTANDTLTSTFQYFPPVTGSFTEGFENSNFPPAGWDIINSDDSTTWERITGVAKTGSASVMMHNFNYPLYGQKDFLRLPNVNISNADSAFLTFQIAAAVKSNFQGMHSWDSLQVLISTDCGATYTSLYKKWGTALGTRNTPSPSSFVPEPSEWRKDSVDLTGYINSGPILLAFLNTTANENNIYLDDIIIYSTSINPNLVSRGFLVTPNPTIDAITVQFYPYPYTLKAIVLYNTSGQKIAEQSAKANSTGRYTFSMNSFANGVYFVQAVFTDKKLIQKVIKR
jgi:hypothetical protein